MNKGELVAKIAEGADITKASAARALDSLINSITEELAGGGEVALVGFGTGVCQTSCRDHFVMHSQP
jgi:DNA-binding protein HU-beta